MPYDSLLFSQFFVNQAPLRLAAVYLFFARAMFREQKRAPLKTANHRVIEGRLSPFVLGGNIRTIVEEQSGDIGLSARHG
ncbi:MAG: hypothetical protein KJ645_07840 [Planctomycetes bacterium]|nr:hypothetical protein [Planctomycetota bacterium]